MQSTLALFSERILFPDLPDRQIQLYIGLLLTFLGFMQVITQVALLRPLIKRLGEQRLLLVGQSALLLAFIGLATVSQSLLVALCLAPFAFGMGVNEPSLQSLLTRFGGGRARGQLLGFYQSARSLALIVGPIWAGYAFSALSPHAVFGVSAGLVVLALFLGLQLLQQPLPSARQAQATGRAGD